jgi:cytidylate kinase
MHDDGAPTNLPPVIITIDGPAGTGKSTVADVLATRLGLEFLDTGAMYRAAALVAIEEGIKPDDGPTLAAAVERAELRFDWTTQPPHLRLRDRDVSRRIRDLDVSRIVSIVAGQPEIRGILVARQRWIADRHPRLVSEGRDQGSVVFPDASARFYLHADAAVRAGRRVKQLRAAGKDADEGAIRADIERRDRLDRSRDVGPLVKPEGAIEVDTSTRTLLQVVDELESIVRRTIPRGRFAPRAESIA